MTSFEYGNRRIEYRVIHSKRKTIGICIRQGDVIVKAPFGISKEQIHPLILAKGDWILRKLQENESIWKQREEKLYKDGECIKFRGKDITLRVIVTSSKKSTAVLEGDELLITTANDQPESIMAIIKGWYYEMARERFKERVEYFAREFAQVNMPNRIRIKDQKTRWGSCSSKGNVNFNYRIIMAPDEILDYIVVHELSHLKHMNHSKDFWNEVGRILPDYQRLRLWLRKNQNTLEV